MDDRSRTNLYAAAAADAAAAVYPGEETLVNLDGAFRADLEAAAAGDAASFVNGCLPADELVHKEDPPKLK